MSKAENKLEDKPRILIVTAVSMTIKAFMLEYINALAKYYEVTVVCSEDDRCLATFLPQGVVYYPIKICRNIDLLNDIKSLRSLVKFMKTHHFDMVHSVTPKAGLLAQIAARLSGVRLRVHTFTGQVWATRFGVSRHLLKSLDRLIAYLSTHLLADSYSQKSFLVAQGVASSRKISVLGAGSIAGVDTSRFHPSAEVKRAVREQLGCADEDVLALFLGRLTREKGVLDLAEAFARVSTAQPRLILLMVGPDEEGLKERIELLLKKNPRVRILGATDRPEELMAAADFLCLPSYREGFGSVVIEAAASGLPCMASAIYGLTDAVEDGYSGVLHSPGDIQEMVVLLEKFVTDQAYRTRLGSQARERAIAKFSAKTLVMEQMRYVSGLLPLQYD